MKRNQIIEFINLIEIERGQAASSTKETSEIYLPRASSTKIGLTVSTGAMAMEIKFLFPIQSDP